MAGGRLGSEGLGQEPSQLFNESAMRIAIVSDIHGNRTAFEAVLSDPRQTAPDLILHGGDLADAGASPVEIVDRIRDLGWQGVVGNKRTAIEATHRSTRSASALCPGTLPETAVRPRDADVFPALGS